MASLTSTIQESIEFQREQEWRAAGVPEGDIAASRQTGMDARDIKTFRDFSSRGFLFVVRCPKTTARAMHGLFRPKVMAVKQKTGTSGVVVVDHQAEIYKTGDELAAAERQLMRGENETGRNAARFEIVNIQARLETARRQQKSQKGKTFVSDYDLMSVWKASGAGWQKLFMSAAHGAARGKWPPDARDLVQSLNQLLVSRIQHGCQDDYQSAGNPGVKGADHFALFMGGLARHLASRAECKAAYERNDLDWVYADDGSYNGPLAKT